MGVGPPWKSVIKEPREEITASHSPNERQASCPLISLRDAGSLRRGGHGATTALSPAPWSQRPNPNNTLHGEGPAIWTFPQTCGCSPEMLWFSLLFPLFFCPNSSFVPYYGLNLGLPPKCTCGNPPLPCEGIWRGLWGDQVMMRSGGWSLNSVSLCTV